MSKAVDPRTPVLIGGGEFTDKSKPEDGLSPHDFLVKVARLALEDTGAAAAVQESLDAISLVEFTMDSPDLRARMGGMYKNPPRTLARLLGHDSMPTEIYAATGGNSPQMLVNDMAERIVNGDANVALVAGAENFGTLIARLKRGIPLDGWGDAPGDDTLGAPLILGTNKPGQSDHEKLHNMHLPVNVYPMFENAIRQHLGHSIEEHMAHLGKLNAPYTEVAAKNPNSWFPVARSAEELTTVTDDNRWVGFPYPKYLNSIIQVNMGAALVMCSTQKADELNIPESQRVYLHGCSDAYDIWNVSERVNYHSSPAIRTMGEKAFKMAGWSVDDVDYIDLYSCFPSAVEIACMELGIAFDDPRGLTITGGLPYFGGPGSAYVMHSIVQMMQKLKDKPGTRGLVTANGWFVTKHSCGLYSTTPREGHWQREAQADYQGALDNDPAKVPLEENPEGEAEIETYTVVHGRDGVMLAIVIGRLPNGHRFIANLPNDPAIMLDLQERDSMGRKGTVTQIGGINIFTPA